MICKELTVKFRTSHQGQHLRYSDGPTASHELHVSVNADAVQVAYVSVAGLTLKSILWPTDVIMEVCVEGIQTPK